MHILHITLHNFRSFRQQGELPNSFSPGTNVIVGRNGSGKSNWLQAVQFCLGLGPFAVLRQEERQAILHEGSGRAAVHAFVEVVLDNSQHRLAVAASTVTIRRTIGWKKDEFFLQRQRCTKQEITSLLEGAGFSKQNPYYIVQQGKVQALCTMSDLERLRLLQQVAGTVLYDEKKRDSVSHMNDNQGRLDQVNDLLKEMQDKLAELESEKQELQAYQQADRQRRALSYALYEKECAKARRQLVQIEEERQAHLATLQGLHKDSKSTHERIRNVESSVLPVFNASYKRWTQQVQRARKQAAASKAALQTREDKLQSAQKLLKEQKLEELSNRDEKEQLQQRLQEAERDLEEVGPLWEEAKIELERATQQRTETEENIQGLYAKQGRAQQYLSVEQRDNFLQSQIEGLHQQLHSRQEKITEQRQSLDRIAKNREKATVSIERLQGQLAQKSKHLTDLGKSLAALQDQNLKLGTARMSAYNQVELAQTELRQAQEAWNAAQTLTRQSTPRATALGLQSLPRMVKVMQLTNKQYFGTIIENFTLKDEKFRTCIEMASQNSLFHVVVDTDETASRLVQALEQDQAGRVTFLPLSQLRPEPVGEGIANDDVRPLLSTCLDYDESVAVAMQHVFGNKWLARTSDIAAEVSRKKHVDVLTLEGDLCSRKGAMTGGYVDIQKSRIAAHDQLAAAHSLLENSRSALSKAQSNVENLQQEMLRNQQDLQRQTAQQKQLEHQKEQIQTQLAGCKSEIESIALQSQQTSKMLKEEEVALQAGQAEVQRWMRELGTPLQTNLSEEDENALQELKELLNSIVQQALPEAQKKSHELGMREERSRLAVNQIKERLEQLNGGRKVGDDVEESDHVDDEAIVELEQAVEEASAIHLRSVEELDSAHAALADAKKHWSAARQELEGLKQEDDNLAKLLEDANEKADRLMNKRSMCISKRETYTRKIQELGSLPPPSELDKYSDKTISELMKLLESINKKLKKYSHVNKKAFDQFVNFSEQREALLKRKSELDQGATKVKELIDNLDRQKDEAINRTFRGVSSHFRDVFKELVPNGAGELIMRSVIDEDGDTNMDDEVVGEDVEKADPKYQDVSLYRGIGIKVRFSAVGENYMMSQLSGGQKALVALALIFSIQRCDPAPFYMFDELDQALDSTYRAAVAGLIERQANNPENPTQFIVTTFRPELVAVSNRCYGVSHQNKVSSIHQLSKKDALGFVADLMNEEEAVGDVTSGVGGGTKTSRKGDPRSKRKATALEGEEATEEPE